MSGRVIVFDVVGTLLDVSGLDPIFKDIFGEEAVREEWFSQVLQSVFVLTIIDTYSDFTSICKSSLDTVAARRDMALSGGEKRSILEAMQSMPPHPDVMDSLESLKKAGLRLAALTNSTPDAANAALARAGISDYFEQILSADLVRRMKPAPEPYRMAAERLTISMDRVRLVSAHAWDIAGALKAGCSACFVGRADGILGLNAMKPHLMGPDLRSVVGRLIEVEGDLNKK